MSPTEKKNLAERLAELDRNEKAKLIKRASLLKKLARSKQPHRSRVVDPEEDSEERSVRGSKSLDEFIWQILQADDQPVHVDVSAPTCLVVGVLKTSAEIVRGEEIVRCNLPTSNKTSVAVGDNVYVSEREGVLFATDIAPRKSVLSRPDVHNEKLERVIAANLDRVVVVVSVVSPPLHPRIIDRYLLAIERGGCEPVLAVNKLDLLDFQNRDSEMSKLEPYRRLGVPIFECVARTGSGIKELRTFLKGTLSAFVGHSGVGKSSLINAFDPRLLQDVGSVSEGYGRGTHTTTRSSLIDLGDLRVIDTPGIRSFGLWDIRREELKYYFPEFEGVGRCRFSDCTHVKEPHCSVKEAVLSGSISQVRYDTYLRMMDSL